MTSVINSARRSTASTFDFIGNVANTANQLVGTGSLAIDALHSKATLMHAAVASNTRYQLTLVNDRELYTAAQDYTDLMEEIHKSNYPSKSFDREAFFDAALQRLQSNAID